MNQVSLRLGTFNLVLNANQNVPLHYDEDLDKLGSGVAGSVYRATLNCSHDFVALDDNKVAVKVMSDQNIIARDSATREIKALEAIKNISHTNPNIATCYGAFRQGDKTYVLLEIATSDINDFMESQLGSNLGKDWLLSQFRGLAGALQAVHSTVPGKSIFHHDIKPANILVCGRDDTFKITDWGCSGVAPLSPQGSPTSRKKGNPPYTAPECRDNGPSSRPHDVWSLGCVYFELLIWFHQGMAALTTFRRRIDDSGQDDWSTGKDGALLPLVITRMNFLHEFHPNEVDIIRRMLNLTPTARPVAKTVADTI